MKKLYYIAVLFTLTLFSCDIGDGDQQFQFEVMPITSVQVPDEFQLGSTYEISVSYNRPNDCYEFNDFLYSVNGAERSVAVVNTVYATSNTGCGGSPESETVGFDFTVTSIETHIFKFFQGTDSAGIDQYHIVEVPVVED
ncbi:hypothetical protein [Winogradskyella tangerina]|uniref:hypothetical protein n=1 Tax=Winogradskyella tangerina TaxID=2023240 RepID=UPI0013007265|nr:hypothetical protein [Winogradskyella tangerina]